MAIDTETTSTDAISAELLGMSFAAVPGEAWYVSVPRETEEAREFVAIFNPSYKVTRF